MLSSWKVDERFKDFRWLYVVFPLITASITSVVHPLRRYALMQANEPLFFAALVGPFSLLAFAVYYSGAYKQRETGAGPARPLSFSVERPRRDPGRALHAPCLRYRLRRNRVADHRDFAGSGRSCSERSFYAVSKTLPWQV